MQRVCIDKSKQVCYIAFNFNESDGQRRCIILRMFECIMTIEALKAVFFRRMSEGRAR